ncbi:hypothetical protein Tco_0543167 [Tanacetum coccineum]
MGNMVVVVRALTFYLWFPMLYPLLCLAESRVTTSREVVGNLERCALFLATHFLTDVTFCQLDSHCTTINIPTNLRSELSDRNGTIKDSPTGKIGMYTRFMEFSNFFIPLSKFLLCVLEYYQINFSQLSVIAASKESHFKIMCRIHGCIPTVGTFHRFYVNSISNGWLSFSKRSGADNPCCFSKNLDSLKNWNNHLFWINASVCLLSIPWFDGVFVKRDPLPTDDVVDLPLVELLDENCTLIRKYPKLFLSVVGLIRSFVDSDIRPNFLRCDDEGRPGKRTLAQNEVPLLEETKDRVISPSAETISLVDHTIEDELKAVTRKKKRKVAFNAGPPPMKRARAGGIVISEPQLTTAGKSLAAMQKLITQSGQNDVGPGPAIHPTEDFVSSSITQTPERECHDETGSTKDGNLQTRHVS